MKILSFLGNFINFMGQRLNTVVSRLNTIRSFDSKWVSLNHFGEILQEDFLIRSYLLNVFNNLLIPVHRCLIKRHYNKIYVCLYTFEFKYFRRINSTLNSFYKLKEKSVKTKYLKFQNSGVKKTSKKILKSKKNIKNKLIKKKLFRKKYKKKDFNIKDVNFYKRIFLKLSKKNIKLKYFVRLLEKKLKINVQTKNLFLINSNLLSSRKFFKLKKKIKIRKKKKKKKKIKKLNKKVFFLKKFLLKIIKLKIKNKKKDLNYNFFNKKSLKKKNKNILENINQNFNKQRQNIKNQKQKKFIKKRKNLFLLKSGGLRNFKRSVFILFLGKFAPQFFKGGAFYLQMSFYFQSASLLGNFLKNILQKNFHTERLTRFYFVLRYIKRNSEIIFKKYLEEKQRYFLTTNPINLFIVFKGKFKKATRKKKCIIKFNRPMDLQKKTSHLDYYSSYLLTRFGTISLKVWLRGSYVFNKTFLYNIYLTSFVKQQKLNLFLTKQKRKKYLNVITTKKPIWKKKTKKKIKR